MSRLQTPLARTLGLRLPIIQAPMAGGTTLPALVIAASNAGVLGSFGQAYAQPDAIRRDADAVRAKTAAPFGINLFVAPQPKPLPAAEQQAVIEAIAPYHRELGLAEPKPVAPPFAPDLEAQLAAVAEIRPAVLTVHLGDLPREQVLQFQKLGIRVGASATNIAEAKRVAELGMDFVIAQGGEAGGHRGTYLRDPYTSMTGTLALVRLIVKAVPIPVVAAGGIMDGAGIAAALALGAQAAQLGTAFLATPESGAPAIHKAVLLEESEDTTLITEKFSGKPARGIANRYMLESAGAPQLPFPMHNSLLGPLRAASSKAGNPEFVAMWAGQAAPLTRALPTAELIAQLEAETIEAIDRLNALRS